MDIELDIEDLNKNKSKIKIYKTRWTYKRI